MIWALLAAALAAPVGWRHDGTATFEVEAAPTTWRQDGTVAWRTDVGSWSNATPVVVGDCVLVTAEPTELVCLDPTTGAVRWRLSARVVDAMQGEERAELERRMAVADAEAAALVQTRDRYSALQRDARRQPGDQALQADLAATAEQLRTLQARLAGVRPYRTPPDKDIVGYATPTPVSDGTHVWALFGNGVVVCATLDGARVWTRWLGPPVEPMLGYHTGVAASPGLVDGVLVVPYGVLRGLDAATGAPRWSHDEPWRHYGAPAVGSVDGLGVVLTPGGQLVRARDGEVLSSDLAALYYIGPMITGAEAFVAGNVGDVEKGSKDTAAVAYDLTRRGDAVVAEERWRVPLPTRNRYYATPVRIGGDLVVVDADATLVVFDAATGTIRHQRSLRDDLTLGEVMPTPTLAAGHLYVSSYIGQTVVLRAGGDYPKVAVGKVGETRASPWFVGGDMIVRTLDAVLRIPGAR